MEPYDQAEATVAAPENIANPVAPNNLQNIIQDNQFLNAVMPIKNILPFLILITIRFLMSYLTRILFLIGVYFVIIRLSGEFSEQLVLQTFSFKQIAMLFGVSSLLFYSIFVNMTVFFGENMTGRLLFAPYRNNGTSNIIEVFWLCWLTDLHFQSGILCIKFGILLTSSRDISFRHISRKLNCSWIQGKI